VKSLVWYFFK